MGSPALHTLRPWTAALYLVSFPGSVTAAKSDGACLEAALRRAGAIDDTLRAPVQEVLQVLVAYAGAWPRGQVNGPYDPRALNWE
jgi:hypothetical protein